MFCILWMEIFNVTMSMFEKIFLYHQCNLIQMPLYLFFTPLSQGTRIKGSATDAKEMEGNSPYYDSYM